MDAILPEDAKAIDENARFLGISMLQLMENAGRGVVERISSLICLDGKKAVILAYTGNKGGDGFVIARHLSSLGTRVLVLLLAKPNQIATEEAKTNFEIASKLRSSVRISVAQTPSDLALFKEEISSADLIVDAMLGTGSKGPLREPMKTAVELANGSRGIRVAIDVPTGIDPATGDVLGTAFRAGLTVTHHRAKIGMLSETSKPYCGKIEVISIGIPPEAELYCGPGDLRKAIGRRGVYSHKGENGRVLVIGGSLRYAGAPSLAGIAALKVGADLVTIAVPSSIVCEVRSYSPDLIVVPLPSEEALSAASIPQLEDEIAAADAVVLGMGLGVDKETAAAVNAICRHLVEIGKPSVIDADALKALGDNRDAISLKGCIITPHAGEFFALTGERLAADREEGWNDRLPAVKAWASKLRCTILLKSRYDLITDGNYFKVKTIGNPGMAVGGTGDVLAGVAGAILCRGAGPYGSAVAASFLNSYAGDLLEEEMGQHFTAEDLANAMPRALKRLKL